MSWGRGRGRLAFGRTQGAFTAEDLKVQQGSMWGVALPEGIAGVDGHLGRLR